MTTKTGPSSWLQLQQKICVVTGAASGIGRAIAAALLEQGARVVLLDRNAAQLAQAASDFSQLGSAANQLLAIACDTSQEHEVQAAAQQVRVSMGDAQVLINNAGVLRAGALDSVSLDDWNQALNVNLTGYLICARAFAAQLRAHGVAQGGASMVHVASIAAKFPQSHSGAYSAAKAGVCLLSRQLALEWSADGVRSNVICPGMIRTPLSAAFYAKEGVEQARAAATASRRVGEAQDIAEVALFLASPRSAYVNAAEIAVDGGMSSMLMDMVPRPGFE